MSFHAHLLSSSSFSGSVRTNCDDVCLFDGIPYDELDRLFDLLYVKSFSAAGSSQFEEEELDDEDLGHAETYADYMPAKRESESCSQELHCAVER